MEEYSTPDPSVNHSPSNEGVREPLQPLASGGASVPLVNRCISQRTHRNPVPLIEQYPVGVKLYRAFQGAAPKGGKRSSISSFSSGSKRRLRWAASNALPALVSQFGMTYHQSVPEGETVKRHLNAFLVALRRHHPGVGYLWILEFQSRGTAHFHLWLTLPQDTDGLHQFLAETWHRIAEPSSPSHLAVHLHERNFIRWEMGSGSYLCKYLDKAAQKVVPDGFTGVGRFWGASRGLVPPPDVLEPQQVADWKGLIRTVCRHHEKAVRWSKWKSRARRGSCSHRLPNGAIVVRRLLSAQAPYTT